MRSPWVLTNGERPAGCAIGGAAYRGTKAFPRRSRDHDRPHPRPSPLELRSRGAAGRISGSAGAWRAGASGERIDVVDPSTGAVFASVADASIEDAIDAVAAAHAALPGWAATAPRKRSEILRRCFELMLERKRACWPS